MRCDQREEKRQRRGKRRRETEERRRKRYRVNYRAGNSLSCRERAGALCRAIYAIRVTRETVIIPSKRDS